MYEVGYGEEILANGHSVIPHVAVRNTWLTFCLLQHSTPYVYNGCIVSELDEAETY